MKELDPTAPHRGCSLFLLSFGCDSSGYYRMAHGTAPIPNETEGPCRTLVARLVQHGEGRPWVRLTVLPDALLDRVPVRVRVRASVRLAVAVGVCDALQDLARDPDCVAVARAEAVGGDRVTVPDGVTDAVPVGPVAVGA